MAVGPSNAYRKTKESEAYTMTRDEALALLAEYNEEPFHIEHGVTVGA